MKIRSQKNQVWLTENHEPSRYHSIDPHHNVIPIETQYKIMLWFIEKY